MMTSTDHIQRVYYLIISLFWLAVALPLALTVLLIQARGLDLFQVGLVMGAYALTIVLLEVPTGGLADAIGRKWVTVMAYGFMALSGILVLVSFSFPMILAAFVLNGVGRALSSGALEAWFVDALQAADPDVELQSALAKAGTFTLLALGLGTLAGSAVPYLFTGLPAEGSAVLTPLSMPLVLAIFVKIVLIGLTILLVKEETVSTGAGNWQQGFQQVPAIVRTGFTLTRRNPTILLLLGTTLAGGLAVSGLESFWQPFFADLLGGSEGNSFFFGVVMGGNFLVGMVGNLLATPLSRLLNKRYGLVCAIFQGAWGMAIVLLALQSIPLAALSLFWLAYMNMGVVNSPHSTLLNREIPAEHRSSMLSIASLATYVGVMIAGAGLGFVAEHSSISAAWILGGAVLVVSLTLYWWVDVRDSHRPHLKKFAPEITP
jgi:DHA1 family quinolone resistance protein-like MFS transporter